MNVPVNGTLPGPSQVPPATGVPPNTGIRGNGALVLQTVTLPLVPAFGAITRTTCTTAVALEQGPLPATV